LPDGAATAVVCNQTIEHLAPPVAEHVFAESFRVLQPGGLLAIYSPCLYESTQAAEPGHINLYTPSRLRREVLAAGFTRYSARDFARCIFGSSRWSRLLATVAYRVMRRDRLSASANCIAYRPAD
jgi:hypothetical protein